MPSSSDSEEIAFIFIDHHHHALRGGAAATAATDAFDFIIIIFGADAVAESVLFCIFFLYKKNLLIEI